MQTELNTRLDSLIEIHDRYMAMVIGADIDLIYYDNLRNKPNATPEEIEVFTEVMEKVHAQQEKDAKYLKIIDKLIEEELNMKGN